MAFLHLILHQPAVRGLLWLLLALALVAPLRVDDPEPQKVAALSTSHAVEATPGH